MQRLATAEMLDRPPGIVGLAGQNRTPDIAGDARELAPRRGAENGFSHETTRLICSAYVLSGKSYKSRIFPINLLRAAVRVLDSRETSANTAAMNRPSAAPASSGHERGKAKRRQLILNTAIQILREEGDASLSMRDIAARAHLSPVTVYNLFGSKFSILQAIFKEELDKLIAFFEANASSDALERIFDLTDLSTEYYLSDEDFYRDLFRTLIRNSTEEIAIADWSVRSIKMHEQVAAAVGQGRLREDTPVDILATVFVRLGKAVAHEWIDGTLTATQARQALNVSKHTILSNYITTESTETMARLAERCGLKG